MKVAIFSAQPFDIDAFKGIGHKHDLIFLSERLDRDSAPLARDAGAVCVTPTDIVDAPVIRALASGQTSLIVVRSSFFDNVDFRAAERCGLTVKWLPGFAPHAIAEHAAGLLLSATRKIPRALARVRRGDFSLDGLAGSNLYEKTVGVIGMGRIGRAFARIMLGFGCKLLGHDQRDDAGAGLPEVEIVSLDELLKRSDIISLHCDMNQYTTPVIDYAALEAVKPGVVLVNTAGGQLVDTQALLTSLKEGRIGAYAADVYQNERDLFQRKFDSLDSVTDPVLVSLVSQPGVLLTPHLGFLTVEAMHQVARTVVNEITYYENLTGGTADQLMI
jgi:D-lactate dehydrogenase